MSVPAAPAQMKFRILIMEGDAKTAYSYVEALDKFGLECRYAADGNIAMSAFSTIQPHLAIVDVALPEVNGWLVCGKIRQTSTIPILLTTGNPGTEDQLKSYKIGADECLLKPCDHRLLAARVLSNLRRVYRYDRAGEVVQTKEKEPNSRLPGGWAGCDACGYMGPRHKFDTVDIRGNRSTACPNCKHNEYIVFSVE